MASPEAPEQREARELVDTLVQTLERNFRGFNISEIIQGGSIGHGTAVPGSYDIDLVIYSRDISCNEILREGDDMYKKWLKELHEFLKRTLGRRYKEIGMTRRSVQFTFEGKIDVDLLISPYWKNQHEFYEYLKGISIKSRSTFTVCASKWQVEFFKRQKPQVKEYIRKAKEWRNKTWPKDRDCNGRPSSYLMSLLVVKAYELSPTNGSTVTRALIDMVTQADKEFNICWEKFYERHDYPSLLPGRPRIVDPSNPANNVWESGFLGHGRDKSLKLRECIHTIRL